VPLTEKGEKIKSNMEEHYGKEKGEQVFYASKNAGKITGVDAQSQTITHSRTIPGLGTTRVAHRSNDIDQFLTGKDYPAPERHKDLLGEVSEPETTPRGPLKEAAAPERQGKAGDAKKAKDQSSTFTSTSSTAGAPMNNLGMGIPSPNPSPNISSQPSSSVASTTTGDSLRAMNARNRAFWSRKR